MGKRVWRRCSATIAPPYVKATSPRRVAAAASGVTKATRRVLCMKNTLRDPAFTDTYFSFLLLSRNMLASMFHGGMNW